MRRPLGLLALSDRPRAAQVGVDGQGPVASWQRTSGPASWRVQEAGRAGPSQSGTRDQTIPEVSCHSRATSASPVSVTEPAGRAEPAVARGPAGSRFHKVRYTRPAGPISSVSASGAAVR